MPRQRKHYYSIEVDQGGSINEPPNLEVCTHDNIFDDIESTRESVGCYNFFLNKAEANKALKLINRALLGSIE